MILIKYSWILKKYFIPEDAASFIGKLQASGGGPVGGEALIDALAKSNKLNFRENSNKMLFVLTDEKPHGKEFGPNEIHPDGCPCQISWRDELKKIRDKNAQFLWQCHFPAKLGRIIKIQIFCPRSLSNIEIYSISLLVGSSEIIPIVDGT